MDNFEKKEKSGKKLSVIAGAAMLLGIGAGAEAAEFKETTALSSLEKSEITKLETAVEKGEMP
jgi:hypothetical protein